jgi:hypothetical protein
MASVHGGGVGGTIQVLPEAAQAVPTPLDARGYRHFLEEPLPAQRFGHGRSADDIDHLMAVLARLMQSTDEGPESLDGLTNCRLPSGYTYLLQLVAHDCVRTPTPFWALPAAQRQVRNARIARLRLDTLYGEGPAACPFAYAPDDAKDAARTRLRLGPMQVRSGAPAPVPLFRDIARAAVASPAAEEVPLAFADPLIADPRNEDNALLAQMTVLFHLTHNAMIGLLGGPPYMGGPRGAEGLEQTEARFACARAATTMIYRNILRKDLLPRLLDPAVLAVYRDGAGEVLLDRHMTHRRGFVSVPLEFSHAAFRFAHSMIRPTYRTADGFDPLPVDRALRSSSARTPSLMPAEEQWILRWSHFFNLGGSAPPANLSLRIGPRYTKTLFNQALFPPPQSSAEGAQSLETAGDRSPEIRRGVAFQDLISASSAGLWSVGPLYDLVGARMHAKNAALGRSVWPDIFAKAKLAKAGDREDALRKWLTSRRWLSRPAAAELDALVADPPLPFYIQFEAEHEAEGRQLGPLGSIIVAEVLYGAMLDDLLPHQDLRKSLPCNLLALSEAMGQGDALKAVGDIADMAGLIRFLAKHHDLVGARPAFL